MKPKVTVLMPVYNAEKFLREAIESILRQTLKSLEFLIIDDGSTDSSVSIINSYSDPRIRLIKNEKNLGISATLNKGIELASCELIARMDSDDISYETRLEKQYEFAENNQDVALISTWMGRISRDRTFQKFSGLQSNSIYYTLLFRPSGIYHPTVMYRKSAVIDAGMYQQKYAEDFSLWCELVKKYKFYVIQEPLLDYRFSETSICRVTKKKEYDEAHNEQVLRNVDFYTSGRCDLSDYEVAFLRGQVDPIVNLRKQELITTCFKKLDYITDSFKSYKNINGNEKMIRKAAYLYRIYLVEKLGRRLRKKEVVTLLLKLKYWKVLLHLTLRKTRIFTNLTRTL